MNKLFASIGEPGHDWEEVGHELLGDDFFVPANIMDGSSRKEYKKTSEVLRIIWCVYPGSDYMNRINLRQNETQRGIL